MAIPGTVQVTGPVAPSLTTDAYPTHDSIYGIGGYREVADITARDAIPIERHRVGMLVWVADRGDTNPETYVLTAAGILLSGSVTINGTINVVGDASTLFLTELSIGDWIRVDPGGTPEVRQVSNVIDNQNLQVGSAFSGSASGLEYQKEGVYAVAFAGTTTEWADGGTYLYPLDGASKKVSIGTTSAPSIGGTPPEDVGGFLRVDQGHIEILGTGAGDFDGPHFVMGTYHFWVDSSNRLRMKNGAPTTDTDGVIVGMQS